MRDGAEAGMGEKQSVEPCALCEHRREKHDNDRECWTHLGRNWWCSCPRYEPEPRA